MISGSFVSGENCAILWWIVHLYLWKHKTINVFKIQDDHSHYPDTEFEISPDNLLNFNKIGYLYTFGRKQCDI